YNFLQIREVFHLVFLRRLAQKLKADAYALKGGVNLRLFFHSPRYSEDIDLDAMDVPLIKLQDTVMDILRSASFHMVLRTFGISSIGLPDLSRAKQTETTQRFKVHVVTAGGEDLFTKIEFSRRGASGGIRVEPVSLDPLRKYRLPPFLCPHYGADTALAHKVNALANRSSVQARDVFDLFLLTTQPEPVPETIHIDRQIITKAIDNAYLVGFLQFRDTVLGFFAEEDRAIYNSESRWDEIRLNVVQQLERLL
ncbi:MAG: hypothetical protein GF350_05410, partial [Chitinivibrionales bacterium]|nr:hypothetical protein [Chitinivibrionales bacterium]